jgi:cbb3-type cytochrome oxidase maturation protein
MDSLYLLIPLALVLLALIVWALLWAIRSGQFDDLEGPAHRILMDEDEPQEARDTRRRQQGKESPLGRAVRDPDNEP